jgi:tetratricopeptide (TPR) repeat protein
LTITEYTSLINKPDAVNDIQSISLEKIVQEFPYFQSARALHLKGLYNQNSFKYNYALKITAAHTTDRSVLFDFITSDTFTVVQKELYEKQLSDLHEISVNEIEIVEVVEPKLEPKINTLEESILTSIKNSTPLEEEIIESTIIIAEEKIELDIQHEVDAEKLEIGKPLDFSKNEKHSFQEWLQLSKIQPISREEKAEEVESPSEAEIEKRKKNELIDKFIETSPKIPPIKNDIIISNIIFEPSNADNSYIMTETLARVYLEQKKYQKAIQAYEILILKYPEKSSFFADRILDIKNLQQNNK